MRCDILLKVVLNTINPLHTHKLMTWLTAMEYLCHKWPRICSTWRKHFPGHSSFMTYHRVCKMTGVTSGAGTATLPEHLSSSPVFSGVHVTRSLAFYVCFVDLCLSFCTFSFGHCSSSIYAFWLPLWYLQTLLTVGSSRFIYFSSQSKH